MALDYFEDESQLSIPCENIVDKKDKDILNISQVAFNFKYFLLLKLNLMEVKAIPAQMSEN